MAEPAPAPRGWLGHPPGLLTLALTEVWERFSYYGMQALLILYMTDQKRGGLGYSDKDAGNIYGWYTAFVYLSALPGGLVADRLIGPYRAVFWGGAVIALGHFSLAVPSLPFFYLGLCLIVIGTGLLKPNVSALVGLLYEEGDPRRDAGFSLFYMGINLGAFVAPLVCGTLGQEVDWHLGFGAAGVGMVLGLVQYRMGKSRILAAEQARKAAREAGAQEAEAAFTPAEWKRLLVIAILFLFSAAFWGAYQQNGSTLNLFADRATRCSIFGWSFPSTWFQALESLYVIALAPVFALLWRALGPREPSSPAKFALGLLFVGLGFLYLVPAAARASPPEVLVSPQWLTVAYLLHTIGELCLSPVGLSLVTKLAPASITGAMMGVWFFSIALGNRIGGKVASYYKEVPADRLFAWVAFGALAAALVLGILIRPIKRLAGGVR